MANGSDEISSMLLPAVGLALRMAKSIRHLDGPFGGYYFSGINQSSSFPVLQRLLSI
jgi:hypothetical protein